MKSATWTIYVYSDDDNTDLIFERVYKNVDEITKDFKLTKSFIYNCMKPERINNKKKAKITERMKRIKITSILHLKTGDVISTFSI